MLFLVARACPNCGGTISDERLARGLPCSKCLPQPKEGEPCKLLKEEGTLKLFRPFCEAEEKLKDFQKLFQKALGFPPSTLQETWIKRLLFRESFAIIAPTGTGKTTFGLLATLKFEGRVLILVPTRLLAQQIGERLEELSQRTGLSRRILVYLGRKKDKETYATRAFDVLVATTAFFYRHLDELMEMDFEFVFIDDVDSFLKRSAHIDRLFRLLGFSEKEIALALKTNKTERDYEKLEAIRKRHAGQKILLVSSATLRPRTNRVLLFRFLLGFDVQRAVSNLRNIVDAVKQLPDDFSKLLEEAASLAQRLGPGGLVFVSSIYGKERVEEAVAFFREKGLRTLSYLEQKPEVLMAEMEKGEFDVAVGLAHLANPLVRGIDLPFILRYALFLGVPKHLIPTKVSLLPKSLHSVLANIISLLEEEERLQAFADLQYLKRYLTLTEEALERYPRLKERLEKIKAFVEEKFSDEKFLQRLESSEEVFLVRREGELYLVVGDAATYIQASGRVSRLTVFGLLKGLAVVLSEDARALKSLERRLRFQLGDDFAFRPLEELDLQALARELTETRRGQGQEKALKELMKTSLVIVESPHKARTIASFFGKPSVRKVEEAFVYEIPTEDRVLAITASLGHVFNLSRRRGFFGVFEEKGRFLPLFDTIKICRPTGEQLVDPEEVKMRCPEGPVFDKKEVLESFRRLGYEIQEVFIGSDPDAEGEKIAYDLFVELAPYNRNIRRLEFHEVTPRAFREALKQPVEFNLNRVKAQLTRRVVDRWVGFVLSRRLWRAFGRKRLSAGRVQSPVLGWVIERAEEAKQKKGRISFLLFGHRFVLDLEDPDFAAEVAKEIEGFFSWRIVSEREEEKHPLPPYTTDTVLQEASQKLGYSTRETMNLLQELFESGLITYHRTDSTRISEVGRYQVAKPYISAHFGEEFFYPRAWGEGGAHEGIRPTRPRDAGEVRYMVGAGLVSLSRPDQALKLYDLIFRRFMASQMRPAKVVVTTLSLETPSYHWEEELITRLIEEGFEKMYSTFSVVEIQKEALPEKVEFKRVPKVELYTEGSLVQEMKKRGLGRPSTYAEIVTTLIQRRYVKVLPGGRLYPTRLGRKVYQYLKEHFPREVDEELTRQLEEAMDQIEEGKLDYQEVLRKAYQIRHYLEETEEELHPEEELPHYGEAKPFEI